MGIHQLLHSYCCFLNTNTAIMWQLIWTAKVLEAEWWQVYGEAWVQGQSKMSQVLGVFGLLDFAMLRPVLTWCAFWNLWTVYLFNFSKFFSGCSKPRILNPRIWGGVHLYSLESWTWLKTFPEIDTTPRNQIKCCAWAGYTAALWMLWKFQWTSVRNWTGSDLKEGSYHYQFWQLWALNIEMSRFYSCKNFLYRSLWNIYFCYIRIHIPYMPAWN